MPEAVSPLSLAPGAQAVREPDHGHRDEPKGGDQQGYEHQHRGEGPGGERGKSDGRGGKPEAQKPHGTRRAKR